jgi:hypothetical protein
MAGRANFLPWVVERGGSLEQGADGFTPFICGAWAGHVLVLEKLIELGVRPSQRELDQALYMTLRHDKIDVRAASPRAAAAFLLARGADPDSLGGDPYQHRDSCRLEALYFAAGGSRGALEVLELLGESGRDCAGCRSWDAPPIVKALQQRNEEVVAFLLAHQGTLCSLKQPSPLHVLAEQDANVDAFEQWLTMDGIKVDAPAFVRDLNQGEYTPLALAARRGAPQAMAALHVLGASVDTAVDGRNLRTLAELSGVEACIALVTEWRIPKQAEYAEEVRIASKARAALARMRYGTLSSGPFAGKRAAAPPADGSGRVRVSVTVFGRSVELEVDEVDFQSAAEPEVS